MIGTGLQLVNILANDEKKKWGLLGRNLVPCDGLATPVMSHYIATRKGILGRPTLVHCKSLTPTVG